MSNETQKPNFDYIADILADYCDMQTSGIVPPANRYPVSDVMEQVDLIAEFSQPAQVPDGLPPSQDSYFSYDCDDGFEFHPTAYDAKKCAERNIDYYREDSYSEGWSESTDGVCWGLVLERSKEVYLGVQVYFDGDLVDAVDYQLSPPSEAAILWRSISSSPAPEVKS